MEQDDILDAYDAVTVPQLRQMAEQIFDFSQLSLSAVGRVPPAEEYAQDVYKRQVHGSGLFTRGQTQVLSVCTLNTLAASQKLDTIWEETEKRYMHHYNFPPYSVGEAKPPRSTNRREMCIRDSSTSMSGLLNSPNSSSLLGISSGRGRATQVVFM